MQRLSSLPPRGTGVLTGRVGERRFGFPRSYAERVARHSSEAELYRRVVLGDVLDSQQSVTVSLATYPLIAITSVEAPVKAKVGEIIHVVTWFQNVGDAGGPDSCWYRVVDVDSGLEVVPRATFPAFSIPAGQVGNIDSPLTMPNKEWRLRIEIGHVE